MLGGCGFEVRFFLRRFHVFGGLLLLLLLFLLLLLLLLHGGEERM